MQYIRTYAQHWAQYPVAILQNALSTMMRAFVNFKVEHSSLRLVASSYLLIRTLCKHFSQKVWWKTTKNSHSYLVSALKEGWNVCYIVWDRNTAECGNYGAEWNFHVRSSRNRFRCFENASRSDVYIRTWGPLWFEFIYAVRSRNDSDDGGSMTRSSKAFTQRVVLYTNVEDRGILEIVDAIRCHFDWQIYNIC